MSSASPTLQPAFSEPVTKLNAKLPNHGTALRIKRLGIWYEISWQGLAQWIQAAAWGWMELGVRPKQSILALGGAGPEWMASLFAFQMLGAELDVALASAEPQAIADAEFILVQGEHEFEKVLRYRSQKLKWVVVADEWAVAEINAPQDLQWMGFSELLLKGQKRTGAASVPPLDTTGRLPCFRLLGDGLQTLETMVFAPHASADQRWCVDPKVVLADFPTTWSAGIQWLLNRWWGTGAVLVIPEIGGDSSRDRRESGAEIWLIPESRLLLWAAALHERVPHSGWRKKWFEQVIGGRTGLFARWIRFRIKCASAISGIRYVISDQHLNVQLRQTLVGLEIFEMDSDVDFRSPFLNQGDGLAEPMFVGGWL